MRYVTNAQPFRYKYGKISIILNRVRLTISAENAHDLCLGMVFHGKVGALLRKKVRADVRNSNQKGGYSIRVFPIMLHSLLHRK